MALEFTSGTYIDHASASLLDDIPTVYGGMTLWAWVYRTGSKANNMVITKDNVFPCGYGFLVDQDNSGAGNTGEVRLILFRGATFSNATDFVSVANVVPANQWTFIAATHDETINTTSRVKIYAGTLTTPVTEVSYYRQQPGTLTGYSSDAAASLYVGNLQRSTANYFPGGIARVGVHGSVLTEGQLRAIQFGPIGAANIGTPLMIGDYFGASGSTGADFSGNGNNWSTNAAAFGHVPLRPRFGGYTALTSTTAGTTPPPPAGQPGGGRVFWFL